MHPTWPEVLGRRLGIQAYNFAMPGGTAANLQGQAQQCVLSPHMPKASGGLLRRETLVVVHTGGNDFIAKMAQVAFGSGRPDILNPNPGQHEATIINQFLEQMYRAGARNFLVSGVPAFVNMPIINMVTPILMGLVNSGQLESIGVSPGDPPSLAFEVQAIALNERWENLCVDFTQRHADSCCIFFNEVDALHEIHNRAGMNANAMWDMTMFHPSVWGHEQLADEAAKCVRENIAPFASTVVSTGGYGTIVVPQAPSSERRQEAEKESTGTAEKADPPKAESKNETADITLQLRNVKGDVAFAVTIAASSTVDQLRVAALAAAPDEQKVPDVQVTLVFKGKILPNGDAPISTHGIAQGDLVVVVFKVPKPK